MVSLRHTGGHKDPGRGNDFVSGHRTNETTEQGLSMLVPYAFLSLSSCHHAHVISGAGGGDPRRNYLILNSSGNSSLELRFIKTTKYQDVPHMKILGDSMLSRVGLSMGAGYQSVSEKGAREMAVK